MSVTSSDLNLYSFYPEESFEISECLVNEKSVMIRLKSKKHNCECPRCHQISNYYHGTYKRLVQDLPILGKNTSVILMAHECPAAHSGRHESHAIFSRSAYPIVPCRDLPHIFPGLAARCRSLV